MPSDAGSNGTGDQKHSSKMPTTLDAALAEIRTLQEQLRLAAIETNRLSGDSLENNRQIKQLEQDLAEARKVSEQHK
jgi:TolA-binding protein